MSQTILWGDTVEAGASWSLRLRRGQELRIEDSEGGANVAALFYNYEAPTERYNMPDTLKAQHTAHLALFCIPTWGGFFVPLPRTRAAGTIR